MLGRGRLKRCFVSNNKSLCHIGHTHGHTHIQTRSNQRTFRRTKCVIGFASRLQICGHEDLDIWRERWNWRYFCLNWQSRTGRTWTNLIDKPLTQSFGRYLMEAKHFKQASQGRGVHRVSKLRWGEPLFFPVRYLNPLRQSGENITKWSDRTMDM